MKQNTLMAAIVAVLAVMVIAYASYCIGKNERKISERPDQSEISLKKEKNQPQGDHSAMTMSEMTGSLERLEGDEFDRAFIEMMIVHHQGAVEMAKLIPSQTKHEELKKLGENILSAQTQEIAQMQEWFSEWGYENTPSQASDMQDMDHEGMRH